MITLNLLPPELRLAHARSIVRESWQRAAWVLAVGLLLLTGLVWTAGQYLQKRTDQVTQEYQTLSKQVDRSDLGTIRRNVSVLDKSLDQLNQALPTNQAWAAQIAEFMASLPTGITLSQMDWSAGGQMTMKGSAALRADFLALEEALKANPKISDLTTTSQASRRENLPFEYKLTWKDT